ncbi:MULTISPECIES: hypothetical protein [unclassified Mesorhizobium]|uniref:hypothetical protein n=1 Tax=unclassified Mesorhizobium TaxID=325217 RepID=UPI000FCB869C|nr:MULTISPECIES: hypothetical protein [unclassified Mesorhizobium]RUW02295.1 hypothetical protein EOA49_07670 [Mesorhizobium sp. M1A.F.Ca.IN.020.04.1.1]RUW15760.1 hypothetical protein EOA53_03220 [Mesorhizobium sp. M1A.F.Ca.IN.020.03.1.1]RWF74639.1 MAG: hypothetical protein EOQ34_04775 [Mesorhizobium sp.]RWG18575.1 MAG: hypothetical protein EOQ58_00870 [Mesorhizobium sp.]RWG28555.1 MAG: hypothetical protein EOQ61_20900 [Mesorhizobium sp.]
MLAYGIIEPDEINILAKAVSDHCSIHKIEREAERHRVALNVIGIFRRGVTDPHQLLEELEKAG